MGELIFSFSFDFIVEASLHVFESIVTRNIWVIQFSYSEELEGNWRGNEIRTYQEFDHRREDIYDQRELCELDYENSMHDDHDPANEMNVSIFWSR